LKIVRIEGILFKSIYEDKKWCDQKVCGGSIAGSTHCERAAWVIMMEHVWNSSSRNQWDDLIKKNHRFE
jgi:hypothetical protein